MFEQSVLPATRTNTRAAFIAVTAAEILGIAGAAIIPLFLIGRPSVPKLPLPVRFQPQHVVLVPVEPERLPVQTPVHRIWNYNPLIAPTRIPQRVLDLHDLPAPDPSAFSADSPVGATGDVVGAPPLVNAPPPPMPPVRQPAAQAAQPVRVSQGVQEAKLIKRVMPVYPEVARSIRQFGTVKLMAVIGKDGHMREIQVLSGPAYLVTAAVAAVRQWIYKPTLLNGEPVEVIAPITVTFTLSQ
jgi:periplasmic protein TonB